MAPSARGTLLVLALACATLPLESVEKYWIAHKADIVVVAQFPDLEITPLRSGGWHLTGKLVVAESLFGPVSNGARLPYEWDCGRCPAPRPSMVNDIFKHEGLWFLRRSKTGWTSAGSEGDPGYRPVKDREDMVKYLGNRRSSQLGNSKQPLP